MPKQNQAPSGAIQATLVQEIHRPGFLPKHLGPAGPEMIRREFIVYANMQRLSEDYAGGRWHFYELSNGGFYLAPEREKPMRIAVAGNGYAGELTPDAAGIVATLFAINHFHLEAAGTRRGDEFAERYHALLDFAREHAECTKIFRAID